MALGTIAAIAGIVSAGVGIASAAQGAPKLPDGASASREIAEAQANMLPYQRQLAAAEQMGGKTTIKIPKHKGKAEFVMVPGGMNYKTGTQMMKAVPYVKEEWQPGGVYYKDGQPLPKTFTRKTTIAEHDKEFDFSGYGTADIEGRLAREMADIQLEMGEKYGTQFADEARKLAELADPEGTAARAKEYELIQQMLNNPPPVSPLSGTIDSQVEAQLRAGAGLDDMSRDLLDQAVMQASQARGGGASSGEVETSMSTGMEGAGRLQAAQNKAGSWLSSGATPQDIDFRREQQNLANLGAFVGGRTPESQFQNLSSAGQGAAPTTRGQQLPQQPPGTGAGANYAVQGYQANVQNAANQANPWMAGLSALINSAGAFGQMRT